jgi:ketosteroid isomerase-like protein
MDTVSAVVDRCNEAWNAHDLEAALALCTEDVLFDSTDPAPDGVRHEGKPAVRAAWEPVFNTAGARFTTEDSFSVGDRLVQMWRFEWEGGHVRGVDVIRVRDGLVSEKLAYVKG